MSTAGPPRDGSRRTGALWRWLAVAEVVLAAAAVVLDLFLPTLVLLGLAAVSLLVRREGPVTLGFHRLAAPVRSVVQIVGLVVVWNLLQFGLITPTVEHLTGQRRDVSQFAQLQGDLPLLLALLALSWTLAAVGEEAAYRGYVQTRVTDALPPGTGGIVVAVLVSAALFGFAHTEQGSVGVILTFLDAIFFSLLRLRYATVWAAVLGHGFSNTFGVTAYFLVGPIQPLW